MNLDQAIATKPNGGYRVICADNPWQFKTFSAKGLDGRPQHYRRMTTTELKAMPVEQLAAKDCHLFFWCSWPFLEQGIAVLRAWGFTYSSNAFLWVKLNKSASDQMFMTEADFHMGQGYTTRKNTEFCLLGRRGKATRNSKGIRELIVSGIREHSRKPEESYRRIEAYSDGPYCELFARQARPGWAAFGNEVGKFDEVAA